MNKANIVLGVGVVVALILGIVGAFRTPTQGVIERVVEKGYGAIPGSEVFSSTFTVNGVVKHYYSCNFKNFASSTPCSYKLPQASTTPELISVRLSENTGTSVVYAGVGANSWATTTNLMTLTGTAGKKIAGTASSTLENSTLEDNIMPYGKYLNFGLLGNTYATGTVRVILREL